MSNWNAKNEMIHLLKRCRDRPELFNKLFLNRPAYWSRQMDLCRSVVEHRTTVAYSGNMVGKDYWIAGIILWWLLTRPDSLCIITGPSQMVLGSVTFKEIRRCLEGAVLPFGGKLSSGLKASPAVIEVAPGWQALGFSVPPRLAVNAIRIPSTEPRTHIRRRANSAWPIEPGSRACTASTASAPSGSDRTSTPAYPMWTPSNR